MPLSKEQKDKLIQALAVPWGSVTLMCDGYRVDLQMKRFGKNLNYRVMTYVNKEWCAAWASGKTAHPEQKFMRKSVRPNISPTKKAQLEKKWGKRFVQKDPFFGGSVTIYLPDWASGRAAIGHLCKVCESILIIDAAEDIEVAG